MSEPISHPSSVACHRRNRLVVRVFGLIGAVAEGPAAIAALVLIVTVLAAAMV
jgi:hypothetical protein